MKVHLFIPCSVDLFFPEIGVRTVKLLEQAGCEVSYNVEQTCCGRWIYRFGLSKMAGEFSKKYINDHFRQTFIVCPDISCVQHIQDNLNNYEWSPVVQSRVEFIQSHLYELTDFLETILNYTPKLNQINGKLAYNAYVDSPIKQKTSKAIGSFLKQNGSIQSLKVDEPGFGASNSIQTLFWQKFTDRILKNFQQVITKEKGANHFVDADVISVKYLRTFVKNQNLPLEVWHTSELFI